MAPRTLIVLSTASTADAAARVAYEGDRCGDSLRVWGIRIAHAGRERGALTEVTELCSLGVG